MEDMESGDEEPIPGLGEAVAFAAVHHGDQRRKGTDIPYLAHLLSVAALVLVDGGDPDETVAAVLHDVLEDTAATATSVHDRFGSRVAALVVSCSDADVVPGEPKPPWIDRKTRYLDHLREPTTDPGAVRIAAADKIDNLEATLRDLRVHGPAVWERFNAGPAQQLWYYRSVAEIVSLRIPGALAERLSLAVAELGDVVGASALDG